MLRSFSDSSLSLTWLNTSGAIALWRLNSAGSFLGTTGYGPYAGWSWQDTRLDPQNHLISTFQGESADGGQTWENFDISTASFDARKSFFTCGCFIGDYNQIAVSDEVVLPTWTDGRNSPKKPAGDSNVWTNVEIRT